MKRNLLLFSRCILLLFPLLSKRFLRFLNDETHFAKQIDGEKALSLSFVALKEMKQTSKLTGKQIV